MAVEMTVFAKATQPRPVQFEQADALARKLLAHLNSPEIVNAIADRHVLGASSHEIQSIIEPGAESLGFSSEKKGLFREYPTSALRPDFYLPLSDSGVILEVERGKTTTNNMDLLDLWKCHICRGADYLFLVVPHVRPSASGSRLLLYRQVSNRLQTFFEPENYVNVDAAFIFGY